MAAGISCPIKQGGGRAERLCLRFLVFKKVLLSDLGTDMQKSLSFFGILLYTIDKSAK